MGKRAEISITESLSELNYKYKKCKDYRKRLRIMSLILTKEKKYKSREELSDFLGVSPKTLYSWTMVYKEFGIEKMLVISNGGKRREVVPSRIHKDLEAKLNNSTDPLLSYNEAVEWVKKEFNIELKYNTLRMYLIRNFGSKLKSPRKSHYKKDDQATKAFKKTTSLTK
mgnify:CR=1 FL=1